MRNDQKSDEELYVWMARMGRGDYGKALDGVWYICAPPEAFHGSHGNLKNHKIVEHEDGTITASPSILLEWGDGQSWHGYLERGVWKTC